MSSRDSTTSSESDDDESTVANSLPIAIHHLSSANSPTLDESDDDQSIAFVADLDTFRNMPSSEVRQILSDRCIFVKGDRRAHVDWEWSRECLDYVLPDDIEAISECACICYVLLLTLITDVTNTKCKTATRPMGKSRRSG